MSFLIHVYSRRTRDYSFTLFEADGTTELVLAAEDSVLIKIGSNGGTPILDLSSKADTAAGSGVDFTAGSGDCTLRLAQDDILPASLPAGSYDVEVNVVDDSETLPADAVKHAEYGVLTVHPTQMGDLNSEQSSQGSSGSSASSSSSS